MTPDPNAEPEPDLALKWHLDRAEEAPGALYDGKVFDASGNGNHGSILAGSFSGSGRFQNSFQVPAGAAGSPGSPVVGLRSDPSPTLQPANVSLVAWARATAPGSGSIVSYGGETCDTTSWYIATAFGSTFFNYRYGPGPLQSVSALAPGASTVWDGEWHSLIGTVDGTAARLYVDGVQVSAASSSFPIAYPGGAGGLRVGDDPGACNGAHTPFKGDIDEVRVYRRALSAGEISYLANEDARVPPRLPVQSDPRFTVRPELAGTPKVGSTVNCSGFELAGSPVQSVAYLWETAPRTTTRVSSPAWQPIDGAPNSANYVVAATDPPSRIRCRVIVANAAGTAEAVSNTLRTDVDLSQPAGTALISGERVVRITYHPGDGTTSFPTLTCQPGEWSNFPSFAYEWLRDGTTIAGEDKVTYTATYADAGHELRCRVTGSNDIGRTIAPPSEFVLVTDRDPEPLKRSEVVLFNPAEVNSLQRQYSCFPGTWAQSPIDHKLPGWSYEYKWSRDEIDIDGATGPAYTPDADTLGRDLTCSVAIRSPTGALSRYSRSLPVRVPLPQGSPAGRLIPVYRDNELYPVSVMALTDEYARTAAQIFRGQQEQALSDLRSACNGPSRTAADQAKLFRARGQRWKLTDVDGTIMTRFEQCMTLLMRPRSEIYFRPEGAAWLPSPGACDTQLSTSGFDRGLCPLMPLPIQPVDPEHSSLLDATQQQTLSPVTPHRVLWDLNRDGKTDISCPGSSPVLRASLLKGNYEARATIVLANSEDTGRFFSLKQEFDFPSHNSTHPKGKPVTLGRLPADQPIWCRNTLTPPPDPELGPCTNAGRIGRVQIVGDLCPMDVRGLAQGNIDAAPRAMRAVLQKVADEVNRQEKERDKATPGFHPGFKTAFLRAQALPTGAAKEIAATAVNVNAALSGLTQAQFQAKNEVATAAEQAVTNAYKAAKGTTNSSAQFALDNLYSAKGTVSINGIDITPDATKDLQTLFAPSAVGESFDAVEDLKGMLVSSPEAKEALDYLTLARKADLDTVLSEVPRNPKELLQRIPIADLLDKIDLGPFELAKAPVDIKLDDDGSATVAATAKFPALSAPGGGDVTAHVELKGDLEGKLQLQQLRFQVPNALLGVAQVKNLDVQYVDGTLAMNGELLFPGIGAGGIGIHNVVIDNTGKLRGFGVSYIPPPGTGIPIGPGVFLTKLGGDFGVRPNQAPFLPARTGIFARPIGISALAPGNTNGCPTIGVEGEAGVYWQPAPWNVHVEGTVGVACVPFGGMKLDLYGDGVADVSANYHFAIEDIVDFQAGIGGYVRVDPNRWQVTLDGMGTLGPVDLPLGVNSLAVHGVLSNRGFALCGKYIISGGAAVNFDDGRPPLTYPELIKQLEIFEGCDLGPWKVSDLRYASLDARQAPTQATFSIPKTADYVPLRFQGSGDVPRVTLTSPSGKVYDFSDAGDGKWLDDKSYGIFDASADRTVALLAKPETGTWTVKTPQGGTQVLRVETNAYLPGPKVTGEVVGGAGPSRRLTYDVHRIPGQIVDLVEVGQGPGVQKLKTITGGGKGKVRFTVSEATGAKRRIEAQVNQDGRPRENIVVARFSAPSPKLGRPGRVRVRRRGSKAIVTWGAARLAASYEVTVDTNLGQHLFFPAPAKRRRVVVPQIAKREVVRARVVGVSAGQRRGPAGRGRLSAPAKPKPEHKPKRGRKRKR